MYHAVHRTCISFSSHREKFNLDFRSDVNAAVVRFANSVRMELDRGTPA